jgi:hypothetical protein
MISKAVVFSLFVPLIGCTPLASALVGGASSVWSTHERRSLEKRVETLEKTIKKESDCLLLCEYPTRWD